MTSPAPSDAVEQARIQAETAAAGRRVAAGCTTIVALPFAVIGISMVASSAKQLGKEPHAWIMLLFGIVFAGFAVLMVAIVNVSSRQTSRVAERRVAAPTEPWRWREEWERGQIRDQSAPAVAGLWIFTIFWNLVSLPLAFVVWNQLLHAHHGLAVIGLVFPLIGLGLLIAASYLSLRRRKFGTSICTLDRTPAALGSSISGAIVSRLVQHPEHGVALRMAAIRKRIRGSGRSRTVTEQILWSSEQSASAASIAFSPTGSTIPFRFDLPLDIPPADERDPNDRIIWRLDASAAVPGVDYAARFELPVFADERNAAARAEAIRLGNESAAARPIETEGVSVRTLATGGEEYRFAAQRSVMRSAGLTLFAFVWLAITIAFASRMPILGTLLFFLLGLVVVAAAVDSWAGVTTVQVDRTAVTIRHHLFGRAAAIVVNASAIASVTTVTDTIGKSAPRKWHIEIRRSDGQTFTVGRELADQQQAEAIAARMRRTLALA